MKNHPLLLCASALLFCVEFSPIGISAATVSWVGGNGDWNTTTNWSTGSLPAADDDVVISSGPAITITHSAGTHTVHSVQSEQAFVLSGGVLAVSSTFQASNTFTLSGGTLQTATVIVTNGSGLVVQSGTFDGVAVDGLLDVGNTFNAAALEVTNGLTLNGTTLVGNPTNTWYGLINFAGSQTLSGNGTVLFGSGNAGYNTLRLTVGGTTLTMGSGITIRFGVKTGQLATPAFGAVLGMSR
jgi:hypothetical protein